MATRAGRAGTREGPATPSEPARDRVQPDMPPWLPGLVRWMDDAIEIPGTGFRIGFDAIVGLLLPGVGDTATATSHLALLWTALRTGVSRVVIARMLLNVAIDVATGMVPLVGDLFDASFKANRRNLNLLEQHAGPRGSRRAGLRDHLFVWGVMLVVLVVVSLPLVALVWLGSWLGSR